MHKFVMMKIVILWSLLHLATGHPQCLDFKPPYDQDQPLEFCSQYSGVSCCSTTQDRAIKSKYEAIKLEMSSQRDQIGCEAYMKELLCQECSPYAAHIFDAEDSGKPREFPGLCSFYCDTFYDKCRQVVPYMYNVSAANSRGQSLQAVLSEKAVFCSYVALVDVDYCYPELLVNSVLNGDISRETRNHEGCLCVEEFASDLANPLLFRMAPDDSGRIFIGQQKGIVEIFFKNKTKLEEPFLDLVDDVLLSSRAGDERGFLNLLFHPNFKENRKFYIYFSMKINRRHHIRISEFKESIANPNRVDKNTERIILEVYQPYSNHNGGEILFGDDGYLYAFLGDGGAGGDPLGFAQNKSSLLGKVLRIDVNTEDPSVPYTVPSDNPFVGEEKTRPEIWAYGVRNIWRCDIDEGHPNTGYGKGRIICGDVGQSAFEEIDLIEKGANYGWNSREGFECYKEETCGKIGDETLPIFAYAHTEGKSVTGGHVYRGCMNPNLQGQYIYGDYVRGRLWALKEDATSGTWKNREIFMCGPDLCFNGLKDEIQNYIMSFGEDDDGEIYVATTFHPSSTLNGGKIFKLVDPRRRGDPAKCRTHKPLVEEETGYTPTTTTENTISTVKTTAENKPKIGTSGENDLKASAQVTLYTMLIASIIL